MEVKMHFPLFLGGVVAGDWVKEVKNHWFGCGNLDLSKKINKR